MCWHLSASAFRLTRSITFPVDKLDIATHDKTLHYSVEIASTDPELEYGLMFRKKIAPLPWHAV